MLIQTISLFLLLTASFITKSMYLETQETASETDQSAQRIQEQLADAEKEKELHSLIRKSSLKKQVAIKIAKWLAEQLISENTLQAKLPTELNSYIAKFALLESLNPKSSKKCELPAGITINFGFLKGLYALDEESEAFNNIDKLINGLRLINLSQTYVIQITPILSLLGKIDINPIDTIAYLLTDNALCQDNIENTKLKDLVQHCVMFNNLDLLIFLHWINEIPLEDYPLGAGDKTYSIIDLACIADENNTPMLSFLIEHAKLKKSSQNNQIGQSNKCDENLWSNIIAHSAILRGLITQHQEKRDFLHALAIELKVNLYESIYSFSPLILCIKWGYVGSFEYFLTYAPLTNSSVIFLRIIYERIIEEINFLILNQTAELKVTLLPILTIFEKHIKHHDTEFAIKQMGKIDYLKEQLLNQLQENEKNDKS